MSLMKVVTQTGVIDQSMLQELHRWKLPLEITGDPFFTTAEEAVSAIEEAVTGEDQVEVRATDLDVLKDYDKTRQTGRLHLEDDQGQKGNFKVEFGVTRSGAYLIPWDADSLIEVFTNGVSYLDTGSTRVFFSDVQELFFGDKLAFIKCVPSASRKPRDD